MAASFQVADAYADFHVNVDKGIDKAIAQIKKRANQLDIKSKLTLDMDTKRVQAELDKLGLKTLKPKIQPELDKSAMARAGRETEDAMSKVAARSNAKFSALAFTALSVGLPAAAAVGVAGVTGALALMPVAAIAAGAMLQKNNAVVETSYNRLGAVVGQQLESMSAVMAGPLAKGADQLGVSFQRLKPVISSAFDQSAQFVQPLVAAVTDAAEGALPGLVRSIGEAGPVIEGIGDFARQAGDGLGEFADNASQGAEGAGRGFSQLGGTVQLLESRLGTLFANLAQGSSGPLRSLDVIVDQVTAGLNRFTAGGSAGMATLSGFTSTASGMVTVLSSVLSALSALPPQVGSFAGSMGAATMIASKFGLDAGKGFEGLGAKVTAAEGNAKKFGAAIGGLAAGAVNPAFLAVAALGVGLNLLGESQQKAAEAAARHKSDVQALTQALEADNGVVGNNTKAVTAKALADKNAANNLAAFGQTVGTATAVIEGNSGAYDRMKFSAGAALATIADQAGVTELQKTKLVALGRTSLDTGQNFDQLKQQILDTGVASGKNVGLTQKYTAAQQNLIEQIINGTGVVGEQAAKQREAHDAYIATEGALTNLSRAQIEARDATVSHTQAIYEQVNAELGVRGAALNTSQALTELAKVNKDGKSTEDDKAAAMLNVENAMQRQVTAAGALAASNAGTVSDSQRLTIQTAAQNAETIKLANSWAGPLPASLQSAISKMSVTEATAAGLKVGVNNLGQAVVTLPNGKNIVLTSTAAAEEARVNNLNNAIKALHDKEIAIKVTTYGDISKAGTSLTGVRGAFAKGGRPRDKIPHLAGGGQTSTTFNALNVGVGGLAKGPGNGTSDSILAAISTDEMVTNARDTARNLSELYAINNGQRNYEKYPDTGRPPERTNLQSAARELLDHLNRGGEIYEDLSFKGASQNSHDQNDILAKQFFAQGGDYENRADLTSWLANQFSGATTQAATSAAASAVQAAAPAMVAAAGKPFKTATAAGGTVTINVYQQPGQDPYALAQQISRIIELNRKVA